MKRALPALVFLAIGCTGQVHIDGQQLDDDDDDNNDSGDDCTIDDLELAGFLDLDVEHHQADDEDAHEPFHVVIDNCDIDGWTTGDLDLVFTGRAGVLGFEAEGTTEGAFLAAGHHVIPWRDAFAGAGIFQGKLENTDTEAGDISGRFYTTEEQ